MTIGGGNTAVGGNALVVVSFGMGSSAYVPAK
jgi:hypothetical protein